MDDAAEVLEGVAVRCSGAGPALVLLHANGGDHSDFDAVAGQLASRHAVHAVDWPGWGDAGSTAEPSAVGYAELLPQLLEQLPGGPFVLVGNSVGGFAAILAASQRPDLVRGLVLVNPGGFTPRWLGTIVVCRVVGSHRLAPLMMRVLPRLYLRRSSPWVTEIRNRSVEMSRTPDRVRVFAAVWRSFTAPEHDARHAASRLEVPTLLVWGRRDPVLPWLVDGRRARGALTAAKVVALPCGHQAFAEMPAEFLNHVEQFLDTLRTESGWK
ncbi:MAG: alpha/beta fold hydrolase [Actinomycetes bacterium]